MTTSLLLLEKKLNGTLVKHQKQCQTKFSEARLKFTKHVSIDTPQQALGGGEFFAKFSEHCTLTFGSSFRNFRGENQNILEHSKIAGFMRQKQQLPPMLHTTLAALTEHFKRKVHSAKMARIAGISFLFVVLQDSTNLYITHLYIEVGCKFSELWDVIHF